MAAVIQRSFAGGEITPELAARADQQKYQTGLATLRNAVVTRQGIVVNRPGFQYVDEVKDSSQPARLLRFVFSDDQAYEIEVGDSYLRIRRFGELLKIDTRTLPTWFVGDSYAAGDIVLDPHDSQYYIANADTTGDDPHLNAGAGLTWYALLWSSSYDYDVGDLVYSSGAVYIAIAAGTNNSPASSPTYWYAMPTTVIGSDFVATLELPTPYGSDELFDLRYIQSADVMTVVHPSHPPQELSRLGSYSWSFQTIATVPKVAAPTDIAITGGAGTLVLDYAVTAVDLDTGAESICGTASTMTGGATSVVSIDQVAYVSFKLRFHSTANHNLSSGDLVQAAGFDSDATALGKKSISALNGHQFIVDVIDATHVYLRGVDANRYSLINYTAGTLTKVSATKALADPTTADVTITWTAPPDTAVLQYNVYRRVNGLYGYVGTSATTSFVDDGIAPDMNEAPPTDAKLFAAVNEYPSVDAYFNQRLCFASSGNDPQKVWASRIGDYHNFSVRQTLQDDDSLAFTIASDQVQQITGLADLGGRLLLFATNGVYAAQGDANGSLTPTSINLRRQSSIGAAALQPLVIDGSAIYVEARSARVREIQYQLSTDGFGGDDLSAFSQHLVDRHSFVEWAYARHPDSIVWAIRDDGELVGMTYLKDQQIVGWHHHDTGDGDTFESGIAVPEGDEDTLYVIVKRTVNGSTKRYIEKLHSRVIADLAADAFFVDCGTTYDGRVDGRVTPSNNLRLNGGTTWDSGETLTLSDVSLLGLFATTVVAGDVFVLYGESGDSARVRITSVDGPERCTVVAVGAVPADLRSVNTLVWSYCPQAITGLDHLEGRTVAILADGFVEEQQVVTGGAITLDRPAEIVHVGLPITADVELLDLEDPQGETLVNRQKLIVKGAVQVVDSGTFKIGPDEDHLEQARLREDQDWDEPTLKTGIVPISLNASWDNVGRIFMRQDLPLPLQVLAVVRTGTLGGKS